MMNENTPAPASDTNIFEYDQYPGGIPDMQGNTVAENPIVIPPVADKLSIMPETRLHPVDFVVANGANGMLFLCELLAHLQAVDPTAKLMPTPDADEYFEPLEEVGTIPKGEIAKEFVNSYLADLTVLNNKMQGSFLVQCQAKFATFKKNALFKQWLVGSPTEFKIQLDRCDLQGGKRVLVGTFLNVVARADLADNFKNNVYMMLQEGVEQPIPEFVVQYSAFYRTAEQTRVYKMIASSRDGASLLMDMMHKICPAPSDDVTFIPQDIWTTLPQSKRGEYFFMHQKFLDNHGALLLRGINDSRILLPERPQGKSENTLGTRPASKKRNTDFSIQGWIRRRKAADGFPLFLKVFPCINGDIEMWFNHTHQQEARAWLSSALHEIAVESGIDPSTEPERAAEMFLHPEKVYRKIRMSQSGLTLSDKRKAYSEYTPHIPAPHAANSATYSRSITGGPKFKKKMQLVFDIDDVESVLSQDPDLESKASTKNKASKQAKALKNKNMVAKAAAATNATATTMILPAAAGPTVQVDPAERLATKEKATAFGASKKALAAAHAAIQKHPPVQQKLNVYSAPGFDVIYDKHGFPFPVVYLTTGVSTALTEVSLLASYRAQKKRADYGEDAVLHDLFYQPTDYATPPAATVSAPRPSSPAAPALVSAVAALPHESPPVVTTRTMWGADDSHDDASIEYNSKPPAVTTPMEVDTSHETPTDMETSADEDTISRCHSAGTTSVSKNSAKSWTATGVASGVASVARRQLDRGVSFARSHSVGGARVPRSPSAWDKPLQGTTRPGRSGGRGMPRNPIDTAQGVVKHQRLRIAPAHVNKGGYGDVPATKTVYGLKDPPHTIAPPASSTALAEVTELRKELTAIRVRHTKEMDDFREVCKSENASLLAAIYNMMQNSAKPEETPASTAMVVHTTLPASDMTAITTPSKQQLSVSGSSQHHTPPFRSDVPPTPDSSGIIIVHSKKPRASESPASTAFRSMLTSPSLQTTLQSSLQTSLRSSVSSSLKTTTASAIRTHNRYSIFNDDTSVASDEPSDRMIQMNLEDRLTEVDDSKEPPLTQPPSTGKGSGRPP